MRKFILASLVALGLLTATAASADSQKSQVVRRCENIVPKGRTAILLTPNTSHESANKVVLTTTCKDNTGKEWTTTDTCVGGDAARWDVTTGEGGLSLLAKCMLSYNQ